MVGDGIASKSFPALSDARKWKEDTLRIQELKRKKKKSNRRKPKKEKVSKNIYKVTNYFYNKTYYSLRIVKNKKQKMYSFKTLDEAISYRDTIKNTTHIA